jgi:hypothetical protein
MKLNVWGAPMTTIQAVIFGIMLASTPSMVLLAFLLWREKIGKIGHDKEAELRRPYRSHISEFDEQPPYPNTQQPDPASQ